MATDEGRVDVLVNNAGIIRDNRIENITTPGLGRRAAVSLNGAFYCTQAAFRHMRERGYGRVLSFSSMSWRGNFGQVNYVAAKAGVVGFTRGSRSKAPGTASPPTRSHPDSSRPRCSRR